LPKVIPGKMSELLNNSEKRKSILKELILELHKGKEVAEVRDKVVEMLKEVPYGEVVEVEQQLISEGSLSEQEVLKFCDLHTEALGGHIDLNGMKIVPPGHPVDTFRAENRALEKEIDLLEAKWNEASQSSEESEIKHSFNSLRQSFNNILDVEKHYSRKENLLFPYLEKYGITGPPKVMWGKHDEIRELLKGSIDALSAPDGTSIEEVNILIEMVLKPAAASVKDMIRKEEEILLPMSLDKLTDIEWYEIYKQTPEIGFCLYDPSIEWKPENLSGSSTEKEGNKDSIALPSGNLKTEELLAILNTLPVDMTFVDKNDKVKYFSQGEDRIFARNRAILNRDVKMCHPPSSVSVVEKILEDFKTGKQDRAPFWIQMKDSFIHIEYFALRDDEGNYLGTLEVSQNLTEKRKLEGEQRILFYGKEAHNNT
jgi:DUF438 domain-containing protein